MNKFLLLLLLSLSCSTAFAQLTEQTASPYFVIRGDSAATGQLPLLSIDTRVNIAGIVADVQVTQVYRNTGKHPIDATYLFPGVDQVSLYGVKMATGRNQIEAQIREQEEAQQVYRPANPSTSTLNFFLEHYRHTFRMNVFSIMPGDSVRVEFSYARTLALENGNYEFVSPAVTAPRYVREDSDDPGKWTALPLVHEAPPYRFSLSVHIEGGVPIQQVSSPGHKITINAPAASEADVLIDPSDTTTGTRDFVLRYSLAGEQVQAGLLAYEQDGEKFFLYTVQPPEHVTPEQLPGREYILLMDVSYPMEEFRFEVSRRLLSTLLSHLKTTDVFNIILRGKAGHLLSERSLPATPENLQKAIDFIESPQGEKTELLTALACALNVQKPEGFSRSIILCTDRYLQVEKEHFDLIRKNINHARLFILGVGAGKDNKVINALARAGACQPFTIFDQSEVNGQIEKFCRYIESSLLTNVQVDFGRMNVYDVEPAQVPGLFAEEPIVIFGKYRGKLRGKITLSGLAGSRSFRSSLDISRIKPDKDNRAIRYLWAGERINRLSNYGVPGIREPERTQHKITRLGLKYNLPTYHTGFVTIDQHDRHKTREDVASIRPQRPNQLEMALISSSSYHFSHREGGREIALICVFITTSSLGYGYQGISTATIPAKQQLEGLLDLQSRRTFHPLATLRPTVFRLNGNNLVGELSQPMAIRLLPTAWVRSVSMGTIPPATATGYTGVNENLHVELWDDQHNPLETSFRVSNYGETELSLLTSARVGRWRTTSLVNGGWMGNPVDRNRDSFRDVPLSRKVQFYNQWEIRKRSNFNPKAGFCFSFLDEQFGQVKHAAASYASNLESKNLSTFFNADLKMGRHEFVWSSIAAFHTQAALFDQRAYAGDEQSLNASLLYYIPINHSSPNLIATGISYMYNRYSESLADLSLRRRESVTGIWGYHKLEKNGILLRSSLRADYHNLYGVIITPSLYTRTTVFRILQLEAAVNRGFRTASTFAENLHLFQSARLVELRGTPDPEKGWKYSIGARCRLKQVALGLGYTRTDYTNQVVTDLDESTRRIAIYNLDGRSRINQLMFNVGYVHNGFRSELSYNFQDTKTTYHGQLMQQPFVSKHAALLKVTFTPGKWALSLLTLYRGMQRLPSTQENPVMYRRSDQSGGYVTVNLNISYQYRKWRFFLNGENLNDYRQQNPVIAADEPRSDYFDASMIYAPIVGRRVSTGVTFKLKQ